jgi:hypothetical protein
VAKTKTLARAHEDRAPVYPAASVWPPAAMKYLRKLRCNHRAQGHHSAHKLQRKFSKCMPSGARCKMIGPDARWHTLQRTLFETKSARIMARLISVPGTPFKSVSTSARTRKRETVFSDASITQLIFKFLFDQVGRRTCLYK